MTSYQEHLEQLEAKGEEVRQLQDALLIAEGSLKQLTLQSVKAVSLAVSLREQVTTLTAERDALWKDAARLDNVCDTMRGALVDALTAASVSAVATEPIIRWAREVVSLRPDEYAGVRQEMTRRLRDSLEAYDAARTADAEVKP